MDIRHFFKKPRLDESVLKDECSNREISTECKVSSEPVPSMMPGTSEEKEATEYFNIYDIGHFLNENVSDEMRFKVLTDPWIPDKDYNFKNDTSTDRSFRHQWLSQYPCISYSAIKKGAFCRPCVLFYPRVRKGVQGSFIVKEFTKYKNFHESIKQHIKSAWHIEAVSAANNFKHIMTNKKLNVVEQMDSALQKLVQSNREKIVPIIKSIVFCGVHGLPLRGKNDVHGIFKSLLEFRIDSGDLILKNHFESCANNAKYVSHRIQNEIINICGHVLRKNIIKDAKNSPFFSVIADQSADISGIEQLSTAIRFVDKNNSGFYIREEFLGFVELKEMNAEFISNKIISSLSDFGLDLTKMVGQGYDGCSVMAGNVSGVHKRIQNKYPAANFFPCASHKLNLVVNDLNDVPEIRNTIGCIKEVINYFRESPLRRREVPRIPLLCETRWTEKYKCLRIFKQNFISLMNALHNLSTEGNNSQTRQRALQLYSSCATPTFLVCLHIISEYSAMIEPVVNVFQGTDQNINSVKEQIKLLIGLFEKDRDFENSEKFRHIMEEVFHTAQELEIEVKIPRMTSKQKNRCNVPCNSVETYYRRSIFLPYLDSLLTSLKDRFSESNEPAFQLFKLIPKYMIELSNSEFECAIQKINEKYGCYFDNFFAESQVWFRFWNQKPKSEISNLDALNILNDAEEFYPSVFKALRIALTLPVTTCTVERSFSTLRRVKTWLRSTINEERLDALCMMNVHRNIIEEMGSKYYDEILEEFSASQRRLQFLFSE